MPQLIHAPSADPMPSQVLIKAALHSGEQSGGEITGGVSLPDAEPQSLVQILALGQSCSFSSPSSLTWKERGQETCDWGTSYPSVIPIRLKRDPVEKKEQMNYKQEARYSLTIAFVFKMKARAPWSHGSPFAEPSSLCTSIYNFWLSFPRDLVAPEGLESAMLARLYRDLQIWYKFKLP